MRQPRLTIPLEPVDSLTVTTLVDNVFDIFMPNQGPAQRLSPASPGRTQPTATMVEGRAPDQPIAEHGLSLLLTVTRGDRSHTLLFDTGVSPDGMIGNMDRLQVDAHDVEAVVCSHGHFDHTAGLDGLVRRLGSSNMPVLITRISGIGGASSWGESHANCRQPVALPSRALGSKSSKSASRASCSIARCW